MITVKLNTLNNAGPKQTAIAQSAIEVLQRVVNSNEFSERVKKNPYSKLWRMKDDETYEQANVDELLNLILTGKEWGKDADYEIDLSVTLKKMSDTVLGSVALGGTIISTAYWFINQCIEYNNPVPLAAHWMHEWVHTAGFYHDDDDDVDDAAYDTGEIVERIGTGTSPYTKSVTLSPFIVASGADPASSISGIVYDLGMSFFHPEAESQI